MNHFGDRDVKRAVIETLDRRVLLAAQLTNGTLVLTGTDNADDIAVMADATFINVVEAKVNGAANYYSLAAITQIKIDALGGDDRITIDPALDSLAYPASVSGGAGNDRITAGSGADTIDAGDGNDKVYANGGADLITGGSGNDTVYGGDGNDTILGGNGNDRLVGEGGNDVFDGGKNNNSIDGGDGDDVFKEKVGSDTVFAGAGNDSGSFKAGGIVYGEAGSDIFVSTGSALLYGGDDNDNLQGTSVWGDAGDDTLAGLNGPDEIHGGDGNDLIRGMDGNDVLIGDAGDDAIFGGGGTDSLFGGDGNDNLYGTNGAKDKHKDLDGTDDVTGGAGSDWFEPDYSWRKGDYTKGIDRAVGSQNPLAQDPDVGLYSGGTLTIISNNGGGSYTSSSGTLTSGSNLNVGGVVKIGSGNFVVGTETDPLGKIGWISTGTTSDGGQNYVPPAALTHTQRLALRSGILELPTGWKLGAITSAADGVVWYRLTESASAAAAEAAVRTGMPSLTIVSGATLPEHLQLGGSSIGATQLVGLQSSLAAGETQTLILSDGTKYQVTKQSNGTMLLTPVTASSSSTSSSSGSSGSSGSSNAASSSSDDVDSAGAGWRFVAIKRETVLITDNSPSVTSATPLGLDTALLAISSAATIHLAGATTAYHTTDSFDSLPTGGPANSHGILVSGGVIWLPGDGTVPSLAAGS